jgi:antirestriction protein
MTTTPRIYAACLAAFNNGILRGAWIDAVREPWAIWADIVRMLAASPVPETEERAIHDYEGFEGASLAESAGIEFPAVFERGAPMSPREHVSEFARIRQTAVAGSHR